VWCRAWAIDGPRAQRIANVAAHPGCFASFPVRTIRVSEVRDRPNDRLIAAAVYPASPAGTGEMRKAGDAFMTQVG
jgi:hypothetical protein